MASFPHLSPEERIGLGLAAAAHVAVIAALMWQVRGDEPAKLPIPERIEVNLAEDVSLQSAAPDAVRETSASEAPTLAERPAPEPAPVAEPLPQPAPTQPARPEPPRPLVRPDPQPVREPVARPTPAPRPTARSTPEPRPTARPTPAPRPTARSTPAARPSASASARPAPRPSASASARPAPRSSASASARPAPRPSASAPARPAGGSRIGADFLEGTNSGERTAARGTPAATFGAAEQASLASAITRQIKPHWSAPQGPDAELLVTVLRFRLNQDGSLAGNPEVVRQSGVNDTNETQKQRHAEQAIRAVRLAAPFNLPEQFYDRWKTVTSQFDRRL